jgi:hypothetical protein
MKPAKKTSYSPAPMSEKAKKTASTRAAKKQAVSKIKKTLSAISPIDTKAAKKAVGITLKTAALPGDVVRKATKAGLKALVKDPRATQRQVGTIKPMPKKLYRQVGTTKPMPEKPKK